MLGNFLEQRVEEILDERGSHVNEGDRYSHSNRRARISQCITLADAGIKGHHENEIKRISLFAEAFKEKYPTFHKNINNPNMAISNKLVNGQIYGQKIGYSIIQDLKNFKKT